MPWKECYVMNERLRFVASLLDVVVYAIREDIISSSAWRAAVAIVGLKASLVFRTRALLSVLVPYT
jgi:hypothetical protein